MTNDIDAGVGTIACELVRDVLSVVDELPDVENRGQQNAI